MCEQVCPHNVFETKDNKANIIDLDKCMECGACANNCAFDALSVEPGVGCAFVIIRGMLTNSDPSCSCGESDDCC